MGNGLLRGPCQLLASEIQYLVPYKTTLNFHKSLQSYPLLVSRRPEILQDAWGLVPGGSRVLLVEAESKLTELKPVNSGPKRTFTVAESVLWTKLCRVQFAAEVAATVSLEEVTKGL